jgi:hypothetical protein
VPCLVLRPHLLSRKNPGVLGWGGGGQIPSYLRKYRDALGARVTKSGEERVTVTAKLRASNGIEITADWVWEFPGNLRLKYTGQDKELVFSATDSAAKAANELQEQILETLVADTPDAFLLSVQRGYIPRFLGDSFAVAGRSGFGSLVDVFETGIPVSARNVPGASVKHFAFDSVSGLLSRVQYTRPSGRELIPVITELSRYEQLGGVVMARTITHSAGRREAFRLELNSAVWGPRLTDGLFTQEGK